MKLELKHLAPYLPYNLKLRYEYGGKEGILRNIYSLSDNDDVKLSIDYMDGEHIWMFKPFLHPLSQLTEQILNECGLYSHIDYLTKEREEFITRFGKEKYIGYLPYANIQWLLQNHYDIYFLIEQNLALPLPLSKEQ